MLSASDKFLAALRASHTPLTRAGVYLPDSAGVYSFAGYLGIESGSLELASRRNIRRQASLRVASLASTLDADYITSFDTRDYLEALTTQSAEITIEWGLRYPDLTEEWVTLARLRVEESTRSANSQMLDITAAYDGGSRVADFNLVTPYAPFSLAGTKLTYVQAIQDLVNAAYPSAAAPTWAIDASIDTTSKPPDNTAFSGDRWSAINTLAQAINANVYVTANGGWSIVPASINRDPVWSIDNGESGVLVGETTAFSRREQYNAVAIRWEAANGGGGLAFVVDGDTTSPTYYDGPFGKKPRPEETLSTVTTSAQAIAAATTILQQYTGFTRSVSVQSVHNPLLEPDDVIALYLPDGSAERHIIDSLSLPLGRGTMQLETRILRGGTKYESSIFYSDGATNYDGSAA